jgi:RNA polymerase sigma-70 factor, ECF subfamily
MGTSHAEAVSLPHGASVLKTLHVFPARPNGMVDGAAVGVEDTLAGRAAHGDMGAFDALVTLLQGRVFGLAMRLLNDRGEAEDLAQEVFVAMYHHLPTFRGESKVTTWVFTITRNRALNRLKFLRRRGAYNATDLDAPHAAAAMEDHSQRPAHDQVQVADLRQVLEGHLRALPDEQRTLVVLRDLEELSYEEIAEATGLPMGTIKSRLHRARTVLAQQLGPQLETLQP